MPDIEVVGAVAPGVMIAVYLGPNTDQGFLDAVTTAVRDTTHRPSVVSISWGGPAGDPGPAGLVVRTAGPAD